MQDRLSPAFVIHEVVRSAAVALARRPQKRNGDNPYYHPCTTPRVLMTVLTSVCHQRDVRGAAPQRGHPINLTISRHARFDDAY